MVQQDASEHVRAGQSELDRPRAQMRYLAVRLDQVQCTFADRSLDHAGGPAAETEMRLRPEELGVRAPNGRANSIHRLYEVLDHPVGLGMIRVETIELAVNREVDPGELL